MQVTAHRFAPHDLVGGDLAVDLVNTATDWDVGPQDWLDSYARLLSWAELTGQVSAAEIAGLARLAAADPAGASQALERVRGVREALYRVMRAAADRAEPPSEALAAVEATWRAAAGAMRLELSPGGATLGVSGETAGLDLIALRASASAMVLLTGERLARLKRCDGPRCGWLFVDTSKAGRRRWCDMATCGNDHKAKRHAEKRHLS
ncbi:MAG: CGNR zinc finger domain-containing protein [Alphaproteobacteria bacterium]|nr:CGNR zinc finger domain-containing protein [Alphaproteobacteria bacterium]MBU1516172.1 CGNR zinc finger domain-containing protein [Alphaproteobacteria bacterium]MBU2096546.1 CGNR zinc finger domain-containing protein [Alphaproteobacteria bacterium]MBU2154048.1 CGNR zinc finger domain-containing protein [Alphaproteobacteria bacterium]MBU2309690.1 CGNR zinc finger domain-containing protein [Alphaproteobacteria bacterium]